MTDEEWLPIETKPPFVPCEERGIYNHNGDGVFYFKPTHWRPLPDDPLVGGAIVPPSR
jgi:hypothetical protein